MSSHPAAALIMSSVTLGDCSTHRQCESIRSTGGGGVHYTVLACEPNERPGTVILMIVVFGQLTERLAEIIGLVREYANEAISTPYQLSDDGRSAVTVVIEDGMLMPEPRHTTSIYARLEERYRS